MLKGSLEAKIKELMSRVLMLRSFKEIIIRIAYCLRSEKSRLNTNIVGQIKDNEELMKEVEEPL